MGAPLASYENPAYTGPRSLNRTGIAGTTHDWVNRQTKVALFEVNESTPGVGKPMNLLYRNDNRYTEVLRPYSRSAWIGSVTTKAKLIVAASTHQEIQQN